MRLLCALLILFTAADAHGKRPSRRKDKESRHACLKALDRLNVPYKQARAKDVPGIDVPVEVTGALGGVTYRTSSRKKTLILDCSLVYSLARAGAYFKEVGLTTAWYSSAYARRNVKGTNKPSKHSYGLALDIHRWEGGKDARISVEEHFEQGLGDDVDCIGDPLTEEGKLLRTVWCRMDRSGLFRFVLSPDSDADHYDHFHVEARPWGERSDTSLQAQKRAQKP